jgi:hypothetical protein
MVFIRFIKLEKRSTRHTARVPGIQMKAVDNVIYACERGEIRGIDFLSQESSKLDFSGFTTFTFSQNVSNQKMLIRCDLLFFC